MILDSKTIMHPPPPYMPPGSHSTPTLSTLPAHILLHIIYLTFPYTTASHGIEHQRKTLYWLSVSLRLVDRALYTASMHVLRSVHIPAYHALVRKPYSSDPFPLLVSSPPPSTISTSPYGHRHLPLRNHTLTLQRETAVLDHFIALKVREDVWADDSELHLERDEAYRDLFVHDQPRSRLEDLVREYGVLAGVVSVPRAQAPTPASSLRERVSMSSVRAISEIDVDTPSKPQIFPDSPTPAYAESPTGLVPPILPSPSAASPSHSPSASTTSLPRTRFRSTFLSSIFTRSKPAASASTSALLPTSPTSPSSPSIRSPTLPTRSAPTPIPISQLSVTLAPRSAGLVLSASTPTSSTYLLRPGPGSSRRTIVSTPRARDEPLEAAAMGLVQALRGWLEGV